MSGGMTIRENFEKRETHFMSPFGCQSAHTKGRAAVEGACPIRTAFQVDRDRIVYSNAFRRLKHKTQVFLSPLGDDYRTRLTHTLEVAQMARAIARALFLNEDLVEAIALGHDIGHVAARHHVQRVTLALENDREIPSLHVRGDIDAAGGERHPVQAVRLPDQFRNL